MNLAFLFLSESGFTGCKDLQDSNYQLLSIVCRDAIFCVSCYGTTASETIVTVAH